MEQGLFKLDLSETALRISDQQGQLHLRTDGHGPTVILQLRSLSSDQLNQLSNVENLQGLNGRSISGVLADARHVKGHVSAVLGVAFILPNGADVTLAVCGLSIYGPAPASITSPSWTFQLTNVKVHIWDEISTFQNKDGYPSWRLDRLHLNIAGRTWQLKDEHFDQWQDVDHVDHERPFLSASLSTSCLPDDNEANVTETAVDICLLLTLALGRHIRWFSLDRLNGDQTRSVSISSSSFQNFSRHAAPLVDNWEKRRLATFIEAAHLALRASRAWWYETISWLHEARTQQYVELKVATLYVVLNKCANASAKADANQRTVPLPSQTVNWLELQDELSGLIARHGITTWNDDRAVALINTIKEWNTAPSFPELVGRSCDRLLLPRPHKQLIGPRHPLLHDGAFKPRGRSNVAHWLELDWLVTAIILRMLGYDGPMFHPFFAQEPFKLSDKLTSATSQSAPSPEA